VTEALSVNDFAKVTLDSAAAGNEPAISTRKSNGLTTTPPSDTAYQIVHELFH